MRIKRSLGSSPLDTVEDEDSIFDYVADARQGTGRSDSIFQDYAAGEHLTLASSFTDKVIAKKRETKDTENQKSTVKKVASYYLELTTIKRMKTYASNNQKSYSSVVERALKEYLDIE